MFRTMMGALALAGFGATAGQAAETRFDFEFSLSGTLSTSLTDYGFVSGQTYGGQFFYDDTTVTNDPVVNRDLWEVSVDFTDDPGGSGVLAGFVEASSALTDSWQLFFDVDGNSNFVYLQLLGDFGYDDALFNTPADRPVIAPPDPSDVDSVSVVMQFDGSFAYIETDGFAPPTTAMAAVPLPATAPLLASGFLVIGWAARRRRTAS